MKIYTNKPYHFFICLLLFGGVLSCDEEGCEPIIVDINNFYVTPLDSIDIDSCGNINKVACSFEFRRGKWVEVQDSLNTQIPDTVNFIMDSIALWLINGANYNEWKTFFIDNHIHIEYNPPSSVGIHNTDYSKETNLFRIGFGQGGLQSKFYHKVE